jgi:dTDP-4-amino-4,6-dideoxygalactose transaminase
MGWYHKVMRIPFNKPDVSPRAFDYVRDAIERGHTSGDGFYTKQCLARARARVPNALLTTSRTHALEMSALLLELQPGDEIIVPAFTFVRR